MTHIESVRAEVFRAIIGREENDSGPYRAPADERPADRRAAFLAPEGRAHWCDMLAELRQALPGLPDLSFATVLSAPDSGPPRRVRDAFAAGTPVARVAYRLSERYGVDDHTPWPVRSVINAKYFETAPAESVPRLSAASMPEIVAAMVRQAEQEATLFAPVQLLTKQARAYLESDGVRVGRLLDAAARSYGVVGAGEPMRSLARNWTTPDWALASAVAADVVIAAAASGQLFYADGEAADAVRSQSGAACPLPSPAGAGVLLMQPGAALAWRESGSRLDVAFNPRFQNRMSRSGPLTRGVWSVLSIDGESGIVDSYGQTVGLEMLTRLLGMLEHPPVSTAGHGPVASSGAGLAERPVVVVRYTAVPAPKAATAGSGGPRDLEALRWRVRGHYRRQWYPTLGEHQLIWVEEHYAERGEDGELVERAVVTKVSQPRSITGVR